VWNWSLHAKRSSKRTGLLRCRSLPVLTIPQPSFVE
jgi:hypothetical protein